MSNYEKDVRPNKNATDVKVDPAIYSVVDVVGIVHFTHLVILLCKSYSQK